MKLMLKKIGVFVMTVLIAFTSLGGGFKAYAAAPPISLPSDEYAKIVGFTNKRTITAKYDIEDKLDSHTISSSTIIGQCHVYIGRYRANNQVDGKWYDAMLIKCAMEPRSFQSEAGRTFYSFSEKLSFSSGLKSNFIYQGNSPTNATTGSSSYSIGINAERKNASVSATVNLKSKYCTVKDKSAISDNWFEIEYDYKPWAIDADSNSERNIMLFGQTWQYATCEWTTAMQSYAVPIKFFVDFGFSQKKHAGFASAYGYKVDKQAIYNLNYSNNMQ